MHTEQKKIVVKLCGRKNCKSLYDKIDVVSLLISNLCFRLNDTTDEVSYFVNLNHFMCVEVIKTICQENFNAYTCFSIKCRNKCWSYMNKFPLKHVFSKEMK